MTADDATIPATEAAPIARPETREEVEKLVRQMVVEVLMLEEVTPESIEVEREHFLTDIGANSIDALELIVTIEEKLKIEFTDDQLNADLVKTLRHFVDAICEKLEIAVRATASENKA